MRPDWPELVKDLNQVYTAHRLGAPSTGSPSLAARKKHRYPAALLATAMVTAVSRLRIMGVEVGPRFTFEGLDPVTGNATSLTVYTGHVALARDPDFRGIVGATSMEPVSFFLPETAPLAAPPAHTWLETSLRAIRSMGNPSLVVFGALAGRVDAAPDPRGGGQLWLQVGFQVPVASVESIEINYRVTIAA